MNRMQFKLLYNKISQMFPYTKFLISALLLISTWISAQTFKILHYTETSGFDHQTRQNSLGMFQDLGNQNGFTVNDDQTGAAFNSVQNLQQYAVVVFSNTSGDQILDSTQRANFEAYINSGGSFVGIHAASDTYRHSTANGTNTGTWDWYAEMLGASVQQNPNHTAANYNGVIDHIAIHSTTANLPDPWHKEEEYYYWENGYLHPGHTIVLMVRSTGPNSYDAARPVSWYKKLAGGGRSFYTALGHDNSNFTSDTAFQNHIRDAVLWAAGNDISLPENRSADFFKAYPNPADELLELTSAESGTFRYLLTDINGKIVAEGSLEFNNQKARLDVGRLPAGTYWLHLFSPEGGKEERIPLIVQ